MQPSRTLTTRRISGVTVLAAAVLILLPALAWLQYSWLQQIAEADRERRERTLHTAASQLAHDFEGELGRIAAALQVDASSVEQHEWSSYAAQYQSWTENTGAPDVVKAIYLLETPEAAPDQLRGRNVILRVWNLQTRTFDETEWPEELQSIRVRLNHDERHVEIQAGAVARGRGPAGGPADRMFVTAAPIGDEQTLVIPIVRFSPGVRRDIQWPLGQIPPPPPPPPPGNEVGFLGFTIVRLNLPALASEVLPAVVRRHLYDEEGHTEFLVGVVARDNPSRVIFESSEGAAAAALANPDTTVPLFGARMAPMMFMRELRRGRPEMRAGLPALNSSPAAPGGQREGPPRADNFTVRVLGGRRGERGALMEARMFGDDGHWMLVAKHRAGSLEAAVSAARTRNFVLSSGVLLLLAATIALIVVSARRGDRLARQQLEFVAAVSHELRTPVSVIGAAAGNLADGVVHEPGRVKTYGETIQTEARRLGETVERVLQLAGIAGARGAAAATPIDASSLINEAIVASGHDLERSGATLEVAVPPNLPTVMGDRAALRSALQNLIGNAIKYGGDARWVRVSAHVRNGRHDPTMPPMSHATSGVHSKRRSGPLVVIVIEDRGVGISAEDLEHIFEPFYRGRQAVTEQIQGSGLGLHLVARIIGAHGGDVIVESQEGRGSRFIVQLPVVADAVDLHAPQESPVTAGT